MMTTMKKEETRAIKKKTKVRSIKRRKKRKKEGNKERTIEKARKVDNMAQRPTMRPWAKKRYR